MLAVSLSPLRTAKDERCSELERFHMGCTDNFSGITGENLLEIIDFDDLFVGIDDDGDVLPDSKIMGCPEVLSATTNTSTSVFREKEIDTTSTTKKQKSEHLGSSNSDSVITCLNQGEEILSKRDPSPKDGKGNKSKNSSHVQRKVKVDWTPELHRRFVQAVEQLGLDKAVPSKILELMGVACLTRHNIASHLQKYRAHQKHFQAREAEAANQQMYCGGKRVMMSPWLVPTTMGFPLPLPHFRPLHVWGHPCLDHMWYKQLVPSAFPSPVAWSPAAAAPPLDPGIGFPDAQTFPTHSLDFHQSRESIDVAIGDALSKPWLPLPLGLKPPSMDTIMAELQRQGISKVLPRCCH